MRLFGKVTHFLHISRCLSYHAPICRPHRLLHGSCKQWKKICSNCVCWQPPQLVEFLPSVPTMIHVQLYSQRSPGVFSPNTNVDMLRKRISFSGTPNEASDGAPNVVPVGIIIPEAKDGKQLKIVIVPLDLANQDIESLRNTLEALNQLRMHANEIDAFTNSMIEDFNQESKGETPAIEEQPVSKEKLNFFEGYVKGIDAVGTSTASKNATEQQDLQAATAALGNAATDVEVTPIAPSVPFTPSTPNAPSTTPSTSPGTMPQPMPNVIPLGDPKETQICASAQPEVDETLASSEPHVDQISIEVPDSLGQRLNDMAIASMHLSFEMDMSNVRDAIMNGDAPEKAEPTLGNDAMVFLETKVEADPENAPLNTVPLRFNALIKGTVQIDADKLNPDQLTEAMLPEYNDAVTSIAASVCSTALQSGFSSDNAAEQQASTAESMPILKAKSAANARMAMKRNQAMKRMKQQHSRPRMSTMPVPEIQSPYLKDGCKYPVIKPKKKCPKKCPLLDDPCKEDPCKRPQEPKKKTQKKKALRTVEITAKSSGDKKGNGANKCASDKKDPCAKNGAGGKGEKGGDKKDPCSKFKKGGDKKDQCAKKDDKKDKCAQKEDPCKKKDPCAKKDDQKDKCAKDDKKDKCAQKEDPCKKKDPCAKKDDKKDKCAKKEDPCKKKDPCAKKDDKKDKCAKKDDKKDKCAKKDDKKDKCAKKDDKKDKCAKKDDKKDDPCKKKDPCDKKGGKGDKKKDPCAKFKKGDKKKVSCASKDKKDKCPKEDPCKKKYSTFSSPVSKFYHSNSSHMPFIRNHNRFMSTAIFNHSPQVFSEKSSSNLMHNLRAFTTVCHYSARSAEQKSSPAKFLVYSTLVRRHYGGMPTVTQMGAWGIKSQNVRQLIQRGYSKKSKKSKELKAGDAKCAALADKPSIKKRKHVKARTGLRTDCYDKYDNECPKVFCTGKCDEVKFPRKKCDKSEKKPRTVVPKKPKKQLPPICMVNKEKDKKDKERNKLLSTGSFTLNQMRMHSDSAHSKRGYNSQINKAALKECPDEELPDSVIEVIRIPASYQICKEHLPRPELKPFDVLISTGSIALTGSDIHVYENANRDLEGMTLGHDATGFVEQVGSCVQHLHVGDRVVMESALSCGVCDYCKRGLYNICADLVYNGFLATHQSHPADLCHRLPDNISMEEGTLTQTLAMGCQACFKANISPTSNVLIIGSTPTAVAAAMCASAIGARKVTIAGTMSSSLEMIRKEFGFNIIHFDTNALFGEVLEAVYSKFQEWPNCAINCAITPMTMNLTVMALQPCGVCVLAECESECASFNALDILMKNIRLIPSFRSANMYPTALQLMKSGRAPMHKFIAKTFSWSMIEDAFKSAQHESNVGLRKIIVNNIEETNIGGLFKKN
ncbi:uncharacterized protein [Drosophila virilis]|uniref:uncharacterized protein n=1 Tax=Drosophila virilis TaxID=7244 RepID=UPI00017D54BE|nr:uncharacterized protein LOC6632555 [Drosophila virilis]